MSSVRQSWEVGPALRTPEQIREEFARQRLRRMEEQMEARAKAQVTELIFSSNRQSHHILTERHHVSRSLPLIQGSIALHLDASNLFEPSSRRRPSFFDRVRAAAAARRNASKAEGRNATAVHQTEEDESESSPPPSYSISELLAERTPEVLKIVLSQSFEVNTYTITNYKKKKKRGE
jgi:hypothetical protein